MISLLNKKEFMIRDWLTIAIPTLGEYRTGNKSNDIESLVSLFTATPSVFMLELEDMGLDFTQIKDYDFFLRQFYSLFVLPYEVNQQVDAGQLEPDKKMRIIHSDALFPNTNFYEYIIIEKNNKKIICDRDGKLIIDEFIYMQTSSAICEIFSIKKYKRKPANDIAKQFILEREREKALRARQKKDNEFQNRLDGEIVALVCHPGFGYNFETVNDLTIYDFNVCVRQIVKKTQYDNYMLGAYAGFGGIKLDKIGEDKLNWLSWR